MNKIQNLNDIIGQKDIITRIKISLESCKQNGKPFNHSLFYGGPGVGKTSLATAIANELEYELLQANGSTLKKVKDILPYLGHIKENTVLFIDECQSLNRQVVTLLLDPLASSCYYLDKLKIQLPAFTFLCATTDPGSLSQAFRDRFIFHYYLSDYKIDELAKIVEQNSNIPLDLCELVAKSGRGNPRISINRAIWITDFCSSYNLPYTADNIKKALKLAKIEENGMEQPDKIVLSSIKKLGPISLCSLSSATGVDQFTIKNCIEPFLIRNQLIKITSKGRQLC